MKSFNGYLAVEPFPNKGLETKTSNGFSTIKQKNTLVELKIIFGSEKFTYGSVFVPGSISVTQYAREVYHVNGQDFILIPETEVRLHELPVSTTYGPTAYVPPYMPVLLEKHFVGSGTLRTDLGGGLVCNNKDLTLTNTRIDAGSMVQ